MFVIPGRVGIAGLIFLAVAALNALPAGAEACRNKEALGISRIVEIDTLEPMRYGRLGFLHDLRYDDFLRDKEVVLTFDDGPLPATTPQILEALDAQCVKATFFSVGRMALIYPQLLKLEDRLGHTVAGHTWSHLSPLDKLPAETAIAEIERGYSIVKASLGKPPAPIFRFPFLATSAATLQYLKQRHIAAMSIDINSDDTVWRYTSARKVLDTTMERLGRNGKGIILMHDIRVGTALILPELLRRLRDGGYKIVHLTTREPVETLESYDNEAELLLQELEERRQHGHAQALAAAARRLPPRALLVMGLKPVRQPVVVARAPESVTDHTWLQVAAKQKQ